MTLVKQIFTDFFLLKLIFRLKTKKISVNLLNQCYLWLIFSTYGIVALCLILYFSLIYLIPQPMFLNIHNKIPIGIHFFIG